MGYYHQDERDAAVGMGCMGLAVIGLVAVCALAYGIAWSLAP